MEEYHEAYVAFDVAKLKHAVAVAEGGRDGEVRFPGEIENRPATIERTINKLARKYDRLHVCFEAGPTGYGLYRQVRDLGHDSMGGRPGSDPEAAGGAGQDQPAGRRFTQRMVRCVRERFHRRARAWTPAAGAGARVRTQEPKGLLPQIVYIDLLGLEDKNASRGAQGVITLAGSRLHGPRQCSPVY